MHCRHSPILLNLNGNVCISGEFKGKGGHDFEQRSAYLHRSMDDYRYTGE